MKTVLAFGDSLTWGYDPQTMLRHDFFDRWPNVVGKALGHKVRVISEGLNGRTTAFDDHMVPAERNGAKVLPTLLASHQPLDLVVIMLGTNDLKRHTGGGRVFESRQGLERLIEICQTFPYQRGYEPPKLLLVAPPHFTSTTEPDFSLLFGHAVEESTHFRSAITKVAEEYGVTMFDASEICEASPIDGVHLDAENTRRLGEALIGPIKKLLELKD
ncbi:SGNH/GDSL hydrolase family protein [Fulvimarina sp. MAC3]|uniref:SGNH/GDSL hydrolase family protein n=1 Tax=Fulvimarina sp. MAC3 TaxID=3148887 RepID=UPI0031FC629E